MREPPRLDGNFYSDNFASPTVQGPTNVPPPKSYKGILIAFGVTFLSMLLLCSGIAAWFYTSFNTASQTTAEYLEQREQANKPLPASIVEQLKNVQPDALESNDDIDSVRTFLSSLSNVDSMDDERIDYPRVVEEMQRTGMAKGVNQFTKFMWIQNIEGAFELPTLGTHFEIIGFEWLKPDLEARVIVATHYNWGEQPFVFLCYLTQESGDWKFYDSRDILKPMSEAQYLAAYAGASVSTSDNYYDFASELYDINLSDDANEEKANRSMIEYEVRRYPSTMRPQAQSLLADYLVIYEDAGGLQKLAEKINDSSFLGAHWYKGKLALMQDDKAAAFERAAKLMEQAGWHPLAAILAAEAAESDYEKFQAAQWLAQSIVILPNHDTSVQQFFATANDRQIQELLTAIASARNAPARYLHLSQTIEPWRFSQLQEFAQAHPALNLARRYAELGHVTTDNEPQKVLDIAFELLQSPDVQELFAFSDLDLYDETYDTTESENDLSLIWNRILAAATSPGMLESAMEASPDRDEFVRRLRDRIISNWYADADWKTVLSVFENMPKVSELAVEEETQAAMGIAQFRMERYEDAYSKLFRFASDHRDELLDPEPPSYAYALMTSLARCAIETDQIDEVLTMLDEPEVAFVAIASALSQLPDSRPAMQELLDWNAEQEETPQLWQHYYRADMAYAVGNWSNADREIAVAIELANSDERIENYTLGGLLYDLAPFSEDVSEWQDLRVEMAVRCGQLSQFIETLSFEGELENYLSALQYSIDINSLGSDPDGQRTRDRILELMGNSNNQYVQRGAAVMKCNLLESDGDVSAALQAALAGCEKSTETYYYGSSTFNTAVRLIAMHEQWEQIEELRSKTSDASEEASVAALVALRDSDTEAFAAALGGYEEIYRGSFWTNDPHCIELLKRKQVWANANETQFVNVGSLIYRFSASGILLLGDRPSGALSEVESAVRTCFGEQTRPIKLEDFPRAIAGWHTETDQGRLVAVVYESLLSDPQTPAFKKLNGFSQGAIGFSLISMDGEKASARMRSEVVKLGRGLDNAVGYIDYQSDSWFIDDEELEWQDRLSASIDHGINRRTPKVDYFPWGEIDQDPTVADGRLRIQSGVIVEDIPVKESVKEPVETPPSDVNDVGSEADQLESMSVVLQESPLLLPILSAGDRVQ